MSPSSPQRATFEVVVTRDAARTAALATRLATQGGHVVALACTRTAPVTTQQWAAVLEGVRSIDRSGTVVVASANAADALARAVAEVGAVLGAVVAVGAVTRDALAGHGIAAVVAARGDAIGAADHVLGAGGDGAVLWPRAEGGRDDGIERLRAAGRIVDAPVAYRTVTAPADDPGVIVGVNALIRGVEVVCVYAPSQVSALAELLVARGRSLDVLASARVVAIGETTAAALRGHGVRVDAVATTPDPDAMAQAIAAVYPGRT